MIEDGDLRVMGPGDVECKHQENLEIVARQNESRTEMIRPARYGSPSRDLGGQVAKLAHRLISMVGSDHLDRFLKTFHVEACEGEGRQSVENGGLLGESASFCPLGSVCCPELPCVYII